MVSKRKAVRVISFSGSSSNGWQRLRQCCSSARSVASYLALEQVSDLLLHALSLPKQALVDAQPLESPFPVAHIVHLGCAVFDCAP
jgi:hypothetical protein